MTEYIDDEDRCELLVDLDCRCPNRHTQVIREPFTPAGFTMRVCDQHADSQVRWMGFLRVSEPLVSRELVTGLERIEEAIDRILVG